MTEVPAGPLLHALEQRRQSFEGLKAVASIEIRKWGGKRTLENVGIVLDGQRRLRMEAYGPLGQTIMALVWDGRDVLFLPPDSDKVVRQGHGGLDQILGIGLDVRELCAVLSGNIPGPLQLAGATQLCGQNNDCVLEVRRQDSVRRVQVLYIASGPVKEPLLVSQELQKAGQLMYQARFDRMETASQYRLPMKIEIEMPERNIVLSIEYRDVEVNVPINNEAFTLSDGQ